MFLLLDPRKKRSVFVLCSTDMQPVGTAFVVSPTLVLSAYHCIADKPHAPTNKHGKNWLLAQRVERMPSGDIHAVDCSVIPVKAAKFSVGPDFAFLERSDNLQFDDDLVLDICPKESLPDWRDDIALTVYHCLIELFNSNKGLSAVHPVTLSTMRTIVTGHRCWTHDGLYGGSSGAPYIISNPGPTFGMVYGMHTQSMNTARRLADLSRAERDNDELVDELSDSHAESYGLFGEGIILGAYTNLINCVFAGLQ